MKDWAVFLEKLESSFGRKVIKKWLHPLKIKSYDARNLYLEAENSFQVSWFEEHIKPLLPSFTNCNHQKIQVHLLLPGIHSEKENKRVFSFFADIPLKHASFENFFPTKGTKEAWEMLPLLFKKKEPFFNPLFIYGPSKVGKTHLLSSIAKQWENQGKKVFYVNGSTFTNHVVMAIRNNLMPLFRNTYRNIDALIVENIHIFSNRVATQEEFFHTFNALHAQGKCLLISANQPPSSLSLEPRLISRFEWGLSLGLTPPSTEEFLPILEKKSKSLGFFLEEEVKFFLIKHFSSGFSSLLTALDALILRTPKSTLCDLWLAQKLLQDLLHEEKKTVTPQSILEKSASYFDLKKEEISGKGQNMEHSFARQIVMYLFRENLNMPFKKIGEFFQRDHSTVITSVRKIETMIKKDNLEAKKALKEIKSALFS